MHKEPPIKVTFFIVSAKTPGEYEGMWEGVRTKRGESKAWETLHTKSKHPTKGVMRHRNCLIYLQVSP